MSQDAYESRLLGETGVSPTDADSGLARIASRAIRQRPASPARDNDYAGDANNFAAIGLTDAIAMSEASPSGFDEQDAIAGEQSLATIRTAWPRLSAATRQRIMQLAGSVG